MNETKIDIMMQVEPIAEMVARTLDSRSLNQIRHAAIEKSGLPLDQNPDEVLLKKIFTIAGICHYYGLKRNPELWLGQTEELLLAKKFLGMPTIEKQKEILKSKGFL